MRNYSSPRINPLSIIAGALVFVAQPLLAVLSDFRSAGSIGYASAVPPLQDRAPFISPACNSNPDETESAHHKCSPPSC
jgi:hypothetical protein